MFTPVALDLERGWPGRIEGDRVVQLAAQTLQAFFTGGGTAREHAEYALSDVILRAPVLHPPSVRVFDGDDFALANPASIYGPDEVVPFPEGADRVGFDLRVAAIIGTDQGIGGFTLMLDWLAHGLQGAKARDFATTLGPLVVTPDELVPPGTPWDELVSYAALNTRLLPGDVIAAPSVRSERELEPGHTVELEVEGIGMLRSRIGSG